jgi:hypothetical protein
VYSANDGDKLILTKIGYGYALHHESLRSQFHGLIGVCGHHIDLYAQIGLPNILHFQSAQAFDQFSQESNTLIFKHMTDPPLDMQIQIIFESSSIEMRFCLSQKTTKQWCFRLTT